MLELAKEHTVVTTEADLALSWSHDNLKDCVDFERLGRHDLAHGAHIDDVNMSKVLPEDHEIFFDPIVLFLKDLNVIDTLLKLLIVFFLEGVQVKDEKMPIVTSDPSKVVVHQAAEKSMTACFF